MFSRLSATLKSIASRFTRHENDELAIVVIDLHSGIYVKHDSKKHTYAPAPADTFTIPENMNVYKINASSLGTCNIVTEPIVEDIINTSINIFHFIENTKKTRPRPEHLSHETIAELLQFGMSTMENATPQFYRRLIGSHKRKRELEEDTTIPTNINDVTDAFHTLGHRYDLHHYKARDVVYNKKYTAENDVMTPLGTNIHIITKETYNTPEQSWRLNKPEITLKTLIHLLKSKGLHNLIIVDGSCSTITEEQANDIYVPLPPREVRSIRRSYKKPKQNIQEDIQVGYGPKKKTRRKRKTRRYSKKKL